jgi:hypothetical protein
LFPVLLRCPEDVVSSLESFSLLDLVSLGASLLSLPERRLGDAGAAEEPVRSDFEFDSFLLPVRLDAEKSSSFEDLRSLVVVDADDEGLST